MWRRRRRGDPGRGACRCTQDHRRRYRCPEARVGARLWRDRRRRRVEVRSRRGDQVADGRSRRRGRVRQDATRRGLAIGGGVLSFVRVEKPHPGVSLITLNRPERMNAMAFDVMIPFREALQEISRDNDVRVVVVTGAGHGFCSGADHEDSGIVPNIDGLTVPTIALRAMELLDEVITTIRKLHQPVIAAVNGAAIGGGMCLALACDVRIASRAAYFRAAGINNGLTATELGIS